MGTEDLEEHVEVEEGKERVGEDRVMAVVAMNRLSPSALDALVLGQIYSTSRGLSGIGCVKMWC